MLTGLKMALFYISRKCEKELESNYKNYLLEILKIWRNLLKN